MQTRSRARESQDNVTGEHVVIERCKTFLDQGIAFAGKEERIRTRLGDDQLDVILDPPQPSPIDSSQTD